MKQGQRVPSEIEDAGAQANKSDGIVDHDAADVAGTEEPERDTIPAAEDVTVQNARPARSRWWPFRGRSESGGKSKELRHRAAELERTVADLRRRKDLAALDEVELTELASETAVVIVRAAKQRQDQAALFAERLLNEARASAAEIQHSADQEAEALRQRSNAEAEELVTTARAEADQERSEAERFAAELRERSASEADELVGRAQAEANRARAEAEQLAKKLRDESAAEADAKLADAKARAASVTRQAKADAKVTLSEAVTRRDELLESLEQQRRWVKELMEDTEELRSTAIDAFQDVRNLLDTAVTRLSGPTGRAERIVNQIDHETDRLRNTVTEPQATEQEASPEAPESDEAEESGDSS